MAALRADRIFVTRATRYRIVIKFQRISSRMEIPLLPVEISRGTALCLDGNFRVRFSRVRYMSVGYLREHADISQTESSGKKGDGGRGRFYLIPVKTEDVTMTGQISPRQTFAPSN